MSKIDMSNSSKLFIYLKTLMVTSVLYFVNVTGVYRETSVKEDRTQDQKKGYYTHSKWKKHYSIFTLVCDT